MSEDYGYYSATGEYVEAPRRQLFRLSLIPYSLRFAIIWTLFFSIIGVGIQYFEQTSPLFMDVFSNFFTTNYGAWFRSFGSFVNFSEYADGTQLLTSILSGWYYFFYTGGLLALVWSLISWIVNLEVVVNRSSRPPKQVFEQVIVERPVYIEQPRSIEPEIRTPIILPTEKAKPTFSKKTAMFDKIQIWLNQGLLLLAQEKIEAAELVYNSIRQEYDSALDPDQELYSKIKSFYEEIVRDKFAKEAKQGKKNN